MKQEKQIETVLNRYMELKARVTEAEGELKLLREQILAKIPSGQYGEMLVSIETRETKSFDWKSARAELSASLLKKLDIFWSAGESQVLRVLNLQAQKEKKAL